MPALKRPPAYPSAPGSASVRRSGARTHGFTLVELAMVLIILDRKSVV